MNNEQFFNAFAKTGSVGLVGGSHFIDKGIKQAQKKITSNNKPSLFSHAFLVGEKRSDGKWWIIESDLEFYPKQIKLGVQENRVEKYFDEKLFPNVALLDFKLNENKKQIILQEALDVVSQRAEYSMREIMGVLFSFANKNERQKENRFIKQNSFICSTFVQHCFSKIDMQFNSNVSLKNMTPEDIYQTKLIHELNKLIRE